MAFSGEGAFGGGIGGAGLGAGIGSLFGGAGAAGGAAAGAAAGSAVPVFGTLLGAGIGALGGALGGGFLGGGKRGRVPDISAEIARINALFERAREAQIASINRQAQMGRRTAASNLAARGVYRSPVSEHVFGGLEEARLGAIGEAEGKLAGQQAATEAELLRALTGASVADAARRDEARQGIFAALAGLGGQLLQGSLQRHPATDGAGASGGAGLPLRSNALPTGRLPFGAGNPLIQNRVPSSMNNGLSMDFIRALMGRR